jgi:hypothetical protein
MEALLFIGAIIASQKVFSLIVNPALVYPVEVWLILLGAELHMDIADGLANPVQLITLAIQIMVAYTLIQARRLPEYLYSQSFGQGAPV